MDFPTYRSVVTGKIHRATVTDADLNYVGSITIDEDLLDAADIYPSQEVQVVDVTNGARLTTYTIAGERGSGVVKLNGAAAHLIKPGDLVIIIAYASMPEEKAKKNVPSVVFVDAENREVSQGSNLGS